MALEDRQLLANFLNSLDTFVREGLGRRDDPVELSNELRELWEHQRERLALAIHALSEVDPATSPPTPFENWEQFDAALAERGLTGRELQIKLHAFEVSAAEFEQARSPTRFSIALAAADIPLGSLTGVLPALEPVKEAKELIELLNSWTLGWLRRRWPRKRR